MLFFTPLPSSLPSLLPFQRLDGIVFRGQHGLGSSCHLSVLWTPERGQVWTGWALGLALVTLWVASQSRVRDLKLPQAPIDPWPWKIKSPGSGSEQGLKPRWFLWVGIICLSLYSIWLYAVPVGWSELWDCSKGSIFLSLFIRFIVFIFNDLRC